ncbi:MAG: hypothetical protein ACI4D0_05305 [Lachnospira sp.]
MERKKLVKRIVMLLSVAMLTIGTIIPSIAEENNHGDTWFEFNFGNGYWQTTEQRVKKDDSYVYMKCVSSESSGDSYNAYVWGWDADLNIRFETGGPYTFYQGTVRKMTNYVYENDGDYAYIKARHAGSGSGIFSGVWSPDSI